MAASRMGSSRFAVRLFIFQAVILSSILLSRGAAAQSSSALPMLLDARADAARAEQDGKPLILFFSLPGCRFCHVIRQNYLLPLLGDSPGHEQALIREVDISSAQGITGLDGSVSTHSALSQSFRIRVAPTVLFVGAGGRLLAEPIVGGDVSGLYGGYLDNAFSTAKKNQQKK